MRFSTLAAAGAMVVGLGAVAAGAEPRFKPGDRAILYEEARYSEGPEKGQHIHLRVAIDLDAYISYQEAILDGTGGAPLVELGELIEMPTGTLVRVVEWHALKASGMRRDAYECVVIRGDERGRTIWVRDNK